MKIKQSYVIVEPLQFDWDRVSPISIKGFEYHLTPELSIRFEGLHQTVFREGENLKEKQDYYVGAHCLRAANYQNIDYSPEWIEEKFEREIMPKKSSERIRRALDAKTNFSCFFTDDEISYFYREFEEQHIISSEIEVCYKDMPVDDISSLPKELYKITLDAFDKMHVQAVVDYRLNKEELEEEYEKVYTEKIAASFSEQESINDKKTRKQRRRRLYKGSFIAAIGFGVGYTKGFLKDKFGIWGKLLMVAVKLGSFAIKEIGRQMMSDGLYFRMERTTVWHG